MGLKRTDEFRADAVRIALTSGLTTARQLIRSINFRAYSSPDYQKILRQHGFKVSMKTTLYASVALRQYSSNTRSPALSSLRRSLVKCDRQKNFHRLTETLRYYPED